MDNLTLVAKIGTTAKVFTVILKESNSAGLLVAKDLTGYTSMKMQVEKSSGAIIMDQVACVIDAVPTTGQITCTTDITVAAHAGLVVGTHRVEFSGLNSAGKKRYWPLNKNSERTYGKFVVQAALS